MVNRNGICVLGPPPTAPIIEVGSWNPLFTLSPLRILSKSLQRPMVFHGFHGVFPLVFPLVSDRPAILSKARHALCGSWRWAAWTVSLWAGHNSAQRDPSRAIPTDDALCGVFVAVIPVLSLSFFLHFIPGFCCVLLRFFLLSSKFASRCLTSADHA